MVDPKRDDPIEPSDDKSLQVCRWIARMPYLEPPTDLLPTVMRSLRPKKLSAPKRILLWARSPKSFTVVPARLAPVVLVFIAIFILSGYWILKQTDFLHYPAPGQSRVPVAFNLSVPGAHSVAVIGTFNSWKPKGYEMVFNPERNLWSLTVRLSEGRYEYAFLVDGHRVLSDPEALLQQDDGFGNENSVVILRAKNEKAT